MASKWAGEGELQAALKQLEGQRPVQATFVKAVVTTAMKYQNEFKMVVYEVERFIKKCDTDDKIAGIFVIDAICRQSKQSGGKDAFVSRFSQRLKDTISFLSRVSSKDKVTLKRTADGWRKKEIFPSDVLDSLQIEADAEGVAAADPSATATFPAVSGTRSDVDSVPSSTIKDQSKVPAAAEKLKEKSKEKSTKRVKLCPFRESGCPFGDKCRFSHYDGSKVKKYKVSPNEPSSEISREVVVRTVEALMYKPIDIVIGNNVFDSSVMKAVVNQAHLAKASVFDFEKDEVVLPDKVNAVPRKRSREEFISCLGRAKPSIYEIKKSDFQRISDAIVM